MKPGLCLAARSQARVDGFTLIELVIFIVVVAILSLGLFAVFSSALKGTASLASATRAQQLAQARMELILAQRRLALNYASFLANPDPCTGATPPAICTAPAGYSFNPAPVVAASGLGVDFNEITVTVQGEGDAQLMALVANY